MHGPASQVPALSEIRAADLASVLVLVVCLFGMAGCSGSRSPDASSPDATGPSDGTEAPAAPASSPAPKGPVAAPTQPPSADEYAGVGTSRPAIARTIFSRTNRVREARGRSPLTRDSTLARIACWHNQDMLVHEYMAHRDADRREPSDRMAREHRRLIGTVGENVFEGEASSPQAQQDWGQSAMKRWLGSAGHRANILRRSFTHLGVCATQQQTVIKATQLFAAVWAYLEAPLPWTLSPGDSLSVQMRLGKAEGPPAQYTFVPVGEPLNQAFQGNDRGRPFDGTLYFPKTADRYGTRFLFPKADGRFTVLSGPRITVE